MSLGEVRQGVYAGSELDAQETRDLHNSVVGICSKGGSGILVAPRLVLTVGHNGWDENCKEQFDYFDADTQKHTQSIVDAREIQHDDYVSFAKGVDLGLRILEHPSNVAFPNWRKPSALDNSLDGDTLTLYGYGSGDTRDSSASWVNSGQNAGDQLEDGELKPVWSYAVYGDITATISGAGNADVLVRAGSWPTRTAYDCRTEHDSSEDSCTLEGVDGVYYVSLLGGDPIGGDFTARIDFDNKYGGIRGPLRKASGCDGSTYMSTSGGVEHMRMHYTCDEPTVDVHGEAGDSGAPIFDQDGAVVGIHTSHNQTENTAMYLGWTKSDGSRPYIDWIDSWIDELAASSIYGDFNGDGLGDAVHFHPSAAADSWVDLSRPGSPAQVLDGSAIDTLPACAGILRTGDFNADSVDDVLCYTEADAKIAIYHGHATSSALSTFSDSANVTQTLSTPCYDIHVADMDGARGDDLYCRRTNSAGRSVYLNTGTASAPFNSQPSSTSATRWCGQEIHVGDFDGNGKDDLLCNDPGTAVYIRFHFGSAGVYSSTVRSQSTTWCPAQMLVGDVNGDAKSDLLCRSSDTNDLKVDFSSGSSSQVPFALSGSDWSTSLDSYCTEASPVLDVADFNGDAAIDLICYDDTHNTLYVLDNAGSGAYYDPDDDQILPYWRDVMLTTHALWEIDAAVHWPGRGIYFFDSELYSKYVLETGQVPSGYPKSTEVEWNDWPAGFNPDAAVSFPDDYIYFFEGPNFIRYNRTAEHVDMGPTAIADYWGGGTWPASFASGIDAGFAKPSSNKVYFFRGDEYIRYDRASGRVDSGYPRHISSAWSGFPADYQRGVDEAVVMPSNKILFFKNGRNGAPHTYLQYDIVTNNAVDPGYPHEVQDDWPANLVTGNQ